jgi:hypothetical protein
MRYGAKLTFISLGDTSNNWVLHNKLHIWRCLITSSLWGSAGSSMHPWIIHNFTCFLAAKPGLMLNFVSSNARLIRPRLLLWQSFPIASGATTFIRSTLCVLQEFKAGLLTPLRNFCRTWQALHHISNYLFSKSSLRRTELVRTSMVAMEVKSVVSLLTEMDNGPPVLPSILNKDNTGAIFIAKNTAYWATH